MIYKKDNMYNLASGFAIIVQNSNNNLLCKSLGPGLLFVFKSLNFFKHKLFRYIN